MPRRLSESADGQSSLDEDVQFSSAKEDILPGPPNGIVRDEDDEMEEQSLRSNNSAGARGSEPVEIEGTENSVKSDDEDDEEEAEEEEDQFKVEAILGHEYTKGVLLYNVKWEGYDETDNTLEPEENLLPGASEALATYHNLIGGVPIKPATSAKKRKTSKPLKQEVSASPAPSAAKRAKLMNSEDDDFTDWLPKSQVWDSHIDGIDTITRDENGNVTVYIRWKNGKRAKVGMDKVYKHCPIPMLKYYEDHLRFI